MKRILIVLLLAGCGQPYASGLAPDRSARPVPRPAAIEDAARDADARSGNFHMCNVCDPSKNNGTVPHHPELNWNGIPRNLAGAK